MGILIPSRAQPISVEDLTPLKLPNIPEKSKLSVVRSEIPLKRVDKYLV